MICNKYKLTGGYNASESNLHSILEEIKDFSYNANLNFDIYFRAATLFEGIIRKHPYLDGN